MNYPPYNIEAIARVLARIEANPECHDQKAWHCGTAHCFGGHAQLDAGMLENEGTTRRDARVHFGLTYAEANYYFSPYRTVPELQELLSPLDSDGFNRAGWDRDGFNRDGWDRDGWDRDGFNRAGWDRAGWDRDGLDINNNHRSSTT